MLFRHIHQGGIGEDHKGRHAVLAGQIAAAIPEQIKQFPLVLGHAIVVHLLKFLLLQDQDLHLLPQVQHTGRFFRQPQGLMLQLRGEISAVLQPGDQLLDGVGAHGLQQAIGGQLVQAQLDGLLLPAALEGPDHRGLAHEVAKVVPDPADAG